jgi:hypothetical protein
LQNRYHFHSDSSNDKGNWGFKIVAKTPVSDELAKELKNKIEDWGVADEFVALLTCKLVLRESNLDVKLAAIQLTANMKEMLNESRKYIMKVGNLQDGIYKNIDNDTSINLHTGQIVVKNQILQPVPDAVKKDLDFADVFGLVKSSSKKLTVLSQTDFENVQVFDFEHEGTIYCVEAWGVFQGKSEEESTMEKDFLKWTIKDNSVQYSDIDNDPETLDPFPYVNFPELQVAENEQDGCCLRYLGNPFKKLASIKEISDFEKSSLKDQPEYRWMHDILRPEIMSDTFRNKTLTIWIRKRQSSRENGKLEDDPGSEDDTCTGQALVFSKGIRSISNKWSFVELFRTNNCIQGFRLTEKGRKIYRTLCFTTDLRQVRIEIQP